MLRYDKSNLVNFNRNKLSSSIFPPDNLQLSIPKFCYNYQKTQSGGNNMKLIGLSGEMENYLHVCKAQRELNDKTVKAYRIDITQFLDYLTENHLLLEKEGLITT